jgi:hypothetical protein
MPAHDRDRKLRDEANLYCETKSNYPLPCKVHKPTLETLQSMTFSDFVRRVVLKKAEQDADESDAEEEVQCVVVPDGESKTEGNEGQHETPLAAQPPIPQQQQQQAQHSTRSKTSPPKQETTTITTTVKPLAPLNHSRPIQYSQGMAKVTLPQGFWDEEGIGHDRTGRGKEWETGAPLGDFVIPSPIKQCIRGLGGIYEYTFLDQPDVSVAEFRKLADEYFESQVGRRIAKDVVVVHQPQQRNGAEEDNATTIKATQEKERKDEDDRIELLERKFWKRLGPTMPPPMYGADMEGSLFGSADCCGWNLSKLHSCLQLLLSASDNPPQHQLPASNLDDHQGGIPGVTTPYLYFGMWASVFCAHTEDMNLLSINYLHAGAPKIWYAIAPGKDSQRFEQLCEGHYHQARTECSEYLRHKRALVSPLRLKKAGIPFTRMVQYPGDAMITLPAGYHFGFNTGFNIAEATNFAVPEWVAYGKLANVCLCRPDSVRIDLHKFERLLQKYELQQRNSPCKRLSWKCWASRQNSKHNERQRQQQLKKEGGSPNHKNQKSTSPSKSSDHERDEETATESSKNAPRKPFWVEVMQPFSGRKTSNNKNGKTGKATSTKSRKRPSKDAIEKEEVWHLAKPLSRKIIKPLTNVLCIIPASTGGADNSRLERKRKNGEDYEDDEGDDEECFAGVIIELTDDHVRVRLHGLTKKDDVWMSIYSPKILLDGGQWGETDTEDVLPKKHYWVEEDSKRRCV